MTYQLTAPLLDACVLGVVESEDVYGYTLTQKVMDVVDISESTLYPVLRRLQKSGLLTTYDQPYQGRNRRYYRITSEGSAQLRFFRKEWETYKNKVSELIGKLPEMPSGLDINDCMKQAAVPDTAPVQAQLPQLEVSAPLVLNVPGNENPSSASHEYSADNVSLGMQAAPAAPDPVLINVNNTAEAENKEAQ